MRHQWEQSDRYRLGIRHSLRSWSPWMMRSMSCEPSSHALLRHEMPDSADVPLHALSERRFVMKLVSFVIFTPCRQLHKFPISAG